MTGITSFDFFGLAEIPNFILCNPNGDQLYSMGAISDRKYSPRFNSLSSISFRADEYVNETLMDYYAFLAHRRLVYIEELETYFMITSVSEKGEGVSKYKEIGCNSLEVEMVGIKLSVFSGTYKLYDVVSPSGTLLGELLTYLPGWSIATVDAEIAVKYRTFDVSDSTMYNFLVNEVEEAYQCVVTFDTVNMTISAETLANVTTTTDIYVSYDNVIRSITVEEATDNLATALAVLGGGGLSINRVNPLGTSVMYDFTYFKDTDWMSQTLINAITDWEALITTNQGAYATLLATLMDTYEEKYALEAELAELVAEEGALEVELAALVRAGLSTSAKNTERIAKTAEVVAKTAEVTVKDGEIAAIIVSLEVINDALSFDSNFTAQQQIDLQHFIVQSSYINSNLSLRDTMSGSSIQAEAQALYDQATSVLSRLSEPRYTFSVEAVNFMMISDFQSFIDEIVLGAVITLEIKNGVTTQPVLLGFDLNYDNPEDFKLIFGNRLRLDDEAFQFSDLMDSAIKGGTSAKVNSEQWGTFDTNYKDDVSTFITSALDASLNRIISGSAQDIQLDKSGFRGRESVGGSYSPEQIWIVNNMIAFTDDNWDSAKMAIGKFDTPGGEAYGIVADYIIGRFIAGNSLTISNEDSTFTVDGAGATLINADLTITTTDGKSIINLDPNFGIKIQTEVAGIFGDRFYVDTAGNLILEGTIKARDGYIGGWTINNSGLYYDSNNYLYPASLSLVNGALTIQGGVARFTGDIYANRLIGIVDWSQLSNIPPAIISDGYFNTGSLGISNGRLVWPGVEFGITGTGLPTLHSKYGIEISNFGKINNTDDSYAAAISVTYNSDLVAITGRKIGLYGALDLTVPDGADLRMKHATNANWQIGRTAEVTLSDTTLSFYKGILVGGEDSSGSGTASSTKRFGLTVQIGNGVAVPTTGLIGYAEVPYNCTLQNVTMVADQTGDAVVSIGKSTYSEFPTAPTIGSPSISGGDKSTGSTIGWSGKTLAVGTILTFQLDSIASITSLSITLSGVKT